MISLRHPDSLIDTNVEYGKNVIIEMGVQQYIQKVKLAIMSFLEEMLLIAITTSLKIMF